MSSMTNIEIFGRSFILFQYWKTLEGKDVDVHNECIADYLLGCSALQLDSDTKLKVAEWTAPRDEMQNRAAETGAGARGCLTLKYP